MTSEDFECIDYVNNWHVLYSERFDQWMIEHDDGYYIFCECKEESYRLAKTFTRPNLEDFQEV